MKPLGIRDVIGPVMVGPSSSHTAGALRIASMVRNLLSAQPVRVRFVLYGSFSRTYRGHGTDKALVAGMLGLHTDDLRIKDSFDMAADAGLEFEFVPDVSTKTPHPNTVDVTAWDAAGARVEARGVSIGGGAAELVRIDGVNVTVTGEFNNMIVRQVDMPGTLAHITECLSRRSINIGAAILYRTRRGGDAFSVFDIDDMVPEDAIADILDFHSVRSVRFIPADGLNRKPDAGEAQMTAAEALELFSKRDFASGAQLLERCREERAPISQIMYEREEPLNATRGIFESASRTYLREALEVMRKSAQGPLTEPQRSMGGLIGGEAKALSDMNSHQGCADTQMTLLMEYALGVLETNASMGRIVAAPTAGSSGVIPAVLFALQETCSLDDAVLHRGLANAAAIGMLISRNATVAGAEGGCQAEIGSASAMAASAAVEMLGGSAQACLEAASMALANMLGLVCDPVQGLVEAPCQKRNASAAANAVMCAHMALAGITNLAPFDEMVEAMRKVGRVLPMELRETALGGMAACPSCMGCK